jgi:hypothetical protein
MIDILKAISQTSVPNLMIGLGCVLVLLAFVRRIGTQIELPESRQRMAAVAGIAFLLAGIALSVAPQFGPTVAAPPIGRTPPGAATADARADPAEGAARRVERIRFEPGASSRLVAGRLAAAGIVEYRLGAAAGQTMEVDLDSDSSDLLFKVLQPGSATALFVGTNDGAAFRGTLPSGGDYAVEVLRRDGAAGTASYTISFVIID